MVIKNSAPLLAICNITNEKAQQSDIFYLVEEIDMIFAAAFCLFSSILYSTYECNA